MTSFQGKMQRTFARAKGTLSQRTNKQGLMAAFMAQDTRIMIFKTQLTRATAPKGHSIQQLSISPVNLNRGTLPPVRLAQNHSPASTLRNSHSTMPRIRGTPRRGAAWYAAESRRKRRKDFERAMAIVARRRRTRARLTTKEQREAASSQANPHNPPGHTLLAASHSQIPSTSFSSPSTRQPDSQEPRADQPYSPCYIIEEAPPEATTTTTGAEHECLQHDATAEEETAKEESGHSHQQEQPAAADGGSLDLLFDIRNVLADQTFRLERMEQRLDMFFVAHSRASTKKQCPTCARPYSFPARWKHMEI
jgi:hypothetical protein